MANIYISCSWGKFDRNLLDELTNILTIRQQSFFHSGMIRPGNNRVETINEEMTKAEIIILLLSARYSGDCQNPERNAGKVHQEFKQAKLFPEKGYLILLQPLSWLKWAEYHGLSPAQIFPTDGKFIVNQKASQRPEIWEQILNQIDATRDYHESHLT